MDGHAVCSYSLSCVSSHSPCPVIHSLQCRGKDLSGCRVALAHTKWTLMRVNNKTYLLSCAGERSRQGAGCKVQILASRVWGLGFRVCKVKGVGYRASAFGFRVWSAGCRFWPPGPRVWGLEYKRYGCSESGFGFRVLGAL